MKPSEDPLTQTSLKKHPGVNEIQKRVLLSGAVLALIALIFPPWSSSSGSSAGFHFILLPPKATAHVNSSLLFLELAGLALIVWFLFVAVRSVVLTPRAQKMTLSGVVSLAVVAVALFAWFIWPRSYTQENGIRIRRLTGTQYVWSNKRRDWITVEEKKEDDVAEDTQRRNTAKPVLDELRQIVVHSNEGADQLTIYNPSNWTLGYSDTKVTIQYYRQTKGRRLLLRIWEGIEEIAPGMNSINFYDAHNFVGTEPLLETIKIVSKSAQRTGGDELTIDLVPEFVFEYQRICQTEYTHVQNDPLTDLVSDEPYSVSSKVVCRPSS